MRLKSFVASIALTGAMALGATGAASASVYTSSASGTSSDGPVSASATLTLTANHLTVALSSLQNNPTSPGQEISGIKVTFGNTIASDTLLTSSGTLININGDNTYSASAAVINHWHVSAVGSSGIDLTAIGGGQP